MEKKLQGLWPLGHKSQNSSENTDNTKQILVIKIFYGNFKKGSHYTDTLSQWPPTIVSTKLLGSLSNYDDNDNNFKKQ